MEIIPNRIKFWRLQRSLTQEGLGQKIGISRQAINSAEMGHSMLSLKHSLRIAKALGVTVEDVYICKNEMLGKDAMDSKIHSTNN